MRKSFLAALGAATGGLLAFNASAAIITQTQSIALTAVNPCWSTAAGPCTPVGPLTFNQVDPSLILNSVKITISGAMQGDMTLTNNGTNPVGLRGTLNVDLQVSVPDLLPASSLFIGLSDTDPNPPAFANILGGGTYSAPLADSDSTSQTLLGGFGAFQGLGTFNVFAQADGSFSVTGQGGGGTGNVGQQFNSSASVQVTIEYDVTERTTDVPAPASLALMGAALAGLSLARRRR